MNSHIYRVGIVAFLVATTFLLACSDAGAPRDSAERSARSESGSATSDTSSSDGNGQKQRIDPRRGGFEISLGEWALTPEAKAIRPGSVSMVITNRGTMQHGFEIEIDEDNSGSGGDDKFKFETDLLSPGESTRFPINLPPGIYKIECSVDGHDDRGMETLLRVARDARLVAEQKESRGASEVSIADFAFSPETIRVPQGTTLTWTNDDPTEHTVTALDSSFESGILAGGETFSQRLRTPGTYRYRCDIHPEMTARVEVQR